MGINLGHVQLTVTNLERSTAFYRDSLGLALLQLEGFSAKLGAADQVLVDLLENPEVRKYPRRTGLYHFALRTPTRLAFAGILQHLLEIQTPLQGFADHLVSEAIYLADPDGNGIEIYSDRPRELWFDDSGSLRMGTEPLDIQDVLSELRGNGGWESMPSGTVLGHIHLHVGYLQPAVVFYQRILGLNLMASLGDSAAFLAADSYHHHIGLNTWNGVGAAPPPPDSVGLRYFSLKLPDEVSHSELLERLYQAGVEPVQHGDGYLVTDPSQNKILIQQRLSDSDTDERILVNTASL